jgi:Ca2+-binding RTX toxin-like protein
VGGVGDDVLVGGGGDDLYHFARGDGQDVIREFDSWNAAYSGSDELRFAAGIAPSDVSISQGDNGRDIVLTIAGGTDRVTLDEAIVSGAQQVERIAFADGTTWTIQDVIARSFGATAGSDSIGGTEGADILRGLGGNDTINARSGDDVLAGGTGDDVLIGGGQNDTYEFARGDGQDIIREYDSWNGAYSGEADRIRFGPGILPSDVVVTQLDTGNDLRLTIAGTSDSITIDNAISDPAQRVEQVIFENGTVWTFGDLMLRATAATTGSDSIYGSELADTLSGGAGNDTLDGRGGDDDLRGGEGNDLLSGGFGNDTYRFSRGDGQDVIQEFNHWNTQYSGIDRIVFEAGIAPEDIVVSQADSANDIVLSIAGTQDRITLDGALTQGGQIIETVEFANGTVWTFSDLVTRSVGATENADTLFGSIYDDALVEGRGGDDTLNGRWGNDVLRGGAGNDTLTGSGGDDVYEFNRGDGIDVITEFDSWNTPYSGTDTVRFGADIAPEDLVISLGAGGADLIFGVSGTADRITVVGGVSTAGQQVERFTFADGTFWSLSDVLTRANAPASGLNIVFGGPASDTLTGGSGDDLIDGRWGADLLSGGAGSDTLIGGGGDDTYRFNLGDGADLIRDFTNTLAMSGGNDVLEFGTGITPGDILLGIAGGDLKLSVAGTTDSITIVGGLGITSQFVETITFQDGTSWSLASIFDRLLSPGAAAGADTVVGTASADGLFGGAGNDTLRGGAGDDTLVGGVGDDRLEGEAGNDRYVYLPGHGNDVLVDFGDTRDNRLVFGAGITPSDLRFSRNSADFNDVRVSFANMTGSILIDNQHWGNVGVEFFEFADGTLWDRARIATEYVRWQATAASDVIWGTYGGDFVDAGAGNDTVDTSDGDDTLIGGAGDDLLQGSTGSDRYVYRVGDGTDTINDYGGVRTNRLVFGSGITPENLKFARVASDYSDMRVSLVGLAGGILIDNQHWNDAGIEFIEFADGTVWNENQILSKYVLDQQTAANDTIWGTYGADQMFGGAGDDLLESSEGDDVLVGGPGNDVLQGGRGNDTYRFALGDGQDIVREYFPNVGAADGVDEIQFAEGITPDDLVVKTANNGEHLVIEIAATQDRITIEWEVNYGNQRVERFRFADGTLLTHADMMTRAGTGTGGADTLFGSYDNEVMSGLGGNDTLDGRGGNDRLSGGRGNDLVIGGHGDDTYLFDRGDGQDVFREYYAGVGGASGNDTIQFGAGISPDDVLVTRANNGEHFVLSLAGTTDRITLEWAVNYPTQRFDRVLFADGTTWNHDVLISKSSGQTSSFYAVEAYADSLAEAAAGFSATPSSELDLHDPSWRDDEAIFVGAGHYHRQRELQRYI